jgi:hypothetical protein
VPAVLSSPGRLFASQDNDAVIGSVARKRSGLSIRAIQSIKNENAPTDVAVWQIPLFGE